MVTTYDLSKPYPPTLITYSQWDNLVDAVEQRLGTDAVGDVLMPDTTKLKTELSDDDYFTIEAVDNDTNLLAEVGRVVGATDPYIAFGAAQELKITSGGVITVTSDSIPLISLLPSATATQQVILITPSAAIAAGAHWDGVKIVGAALDPLTGAASYIHGFAVDFSGVLSADGDDAVISGTYVTLPTGDTGSAWAHAHVMNELTVAGTQIGFGSLGASLVLSATGTYRGLWLDWDGITRDAGAPVLEGLRIELPASYTSYGTSFAAYFSGGGETVTLCDGTDAIVVSGNISIGANLLKTTNLALVEANSTNLWLRNTANDAMRSLILSSLTYESAIGVYGGQNTTISSADTNDLYTQIQARDTGVGLVEIARMAGAADPYFSTGGSQQVKFYHSGAVDFGNVAVTNVGAAGNDFGASNTLVATTFSGNVELSKSSPVFALTDTGEAAPLGRFSWLSYSDLFYVRGKNAADDGWQDIVVYERIADGGLVDFKGTDGIKVAGPYTPAAADTHNIGSAAAEIANLYIGTGKIYLFTDQNEYFYSGGSTIQFGTGGSDRLTLYDSELKPNANAGLSLGTDALEWNDLWIDGIAYLDAVEMHGVISAGTMSFEQSATAWIATKDQTDAYLYFRATDTGVGLVEIARLVGAADPYFSMGGSQEFKFYNSGVGTLGGATTLGNSLMGSVDAITATSETVAASVATVVTEITTNGDSDLDNVSLANGTDGQVKIFSVVAVGNAADSVKITPASMIGGTQITFAASPLGLGCMMVYDSGAAGWIVTGNNGGTIA